MLAQSLLFGPIAVALHLVTGIGPLSTVPPLAPTIRPNPIHFRTAQSQLIEPGLAAAETKARYKPAGVGTPKRTAVGTRRGNICQTQAALVALLPRISASIPNREEKVYVGQTFANYPTFFFYIPPNYQAPTRFILWNEKRQKIYSTALKLESRAGSIASVRLPSTLPPLQLNQVYDWELTTECSTPEETLLISTDGWTMRIEPSPALVKQLQQASPMAQPTLYAEAGAWHDALSSLVELRRQRPNDAKLLAEWRELLQSGNLAPAIVAAPLQLP